MESVGARPCPRTGHSCISHLGVLIVMGGLDAHGHVLDDVWAFDTVGRVWRQLEVAGGARPAGRRGHSAALHGVNMYVYGGEGEGGHVFGDLWRLNLATATWVECHTTGARPGPRAFHASARVSHSLVVLGGVGAPAGSRAHVIDLNTLSWVTSGEPHPSCVRIGLAAAGLGPAVAVYGGAGEISSPASSEVALFWPESGVWRTVGHAVASRRCFFAAVAAGPSSLFVHGGRSGPAREATTHTDACLLVKEGDDELEAAGTHPPAQTAPVSPSKEHSQLFVSLHHRPVLISPLSTTASSSATKAKSSRRPAAATASPLKTTRGAYSSPSRVPADLFHRLNDDATPPAPQHKQPPVSNDHHSLAPFTTPMSVVDRVVYSRQVSTTSPLVSRSSYVALVDPPLPVGQSLLEAESTAALNLLASLRKAQDRIAELERTVTVMSSQQQQEPRRKVEVEEVAVEVEKPPQSPSPAPPVSLPKSAEKVWPVSTVGDVSTHLQDREPVWQAALRMYETEPGYASPLRSTLPEEVGSLPEASAPLQSKMEEHMSMQARLAAAEKAREAAEATRQPPAQPQPQQPHQPQQQQQQQQPSQESEIEALGAAIDLASKGAAVWKHPFHGSASSKPKLKDIWYEPVSGLLRWCPAGTRAKAKKTKRKDGTVLHSLRLADVRAVEFGATSGCLRPRIGRGTQFPWRCISLMTETRSLDLQPTADDAAARWLVALSRLVRTAQQSKGKPPSVQALTQSEAESQQKSIKTTHRTAKAAFGPPPKF